MDGWKLIKADSAPTADGLIYSQNVTLRRVGEVGRRSGLEIASVASGAVEIGPYFFPSESYGVLLVTDAGAINKVAL